MVAHVVIGNGPSRSGFDLEKLRDHLTVGANALYRDWDPNYLVAFDSGILEELIEEFPRDTRTRVIVPHWWRQFEFEHYRDKGLTDFPPRENAGSVALSYMIATHDSNVYMIGMDSFVTGDDGTRNVYEGTRSYGAATRSSTIDVRNRVTYMEWMVDRYPGIGFHVVNDRAGSLAGDLPNKPNAHLIKYTEFERIL